jgi:hypothetical protein
MSWTRPRKPWRARELAQLVIPAPDDIQGWKTLRATFYEKTGYRWGDNRIQLGHVLQLITGTYRTSTARKKAVEYLMRGPYLPDVTELLRKFGLRESTEAAIKKDAKARKRRLRAGKGSAETQ